MIRCHCFILVNKIHPVDEYISRGTNGIIISFLLFKMNDMKNKKLEQYLFNS